MDHFSLLPLELKEYIFKFLPPEDLWTCLSVSSEWRRIASFEKQWKNICAKRYLGIDDLSIEEEDDSFFICKYALLWKQNAQTVKRWRTNNFKELMIPYKNSEALTCRRIYTHRNKMALITSKVLNGNAVSEHIQIYTFGKKTNSHDDISLKLTPHAVTINNNYVIISNGNIVISYRKDVEYKVYCGMAFCDDSRLHIATEGIPEFIALKLRIGPYVRMEALSNEYLWLSCLNKSSQLLYVVNLNTLHLQDINITSRLVCATKKHVVVSTMEDIQVFTVKGELILKLNVRGRFKATDDFIVTLPKQGQPADVWDMDGNKLHTLPGPIIFDLDPIRHLMYVCTQYREEDCMMSAICLKTGAQRWFAEMQKSWLGEIDDMYQVCDKFLIIDLYGEQSTPNFNYAYIYDLDNKILLYKTVLNGYTLRISDNLWVQKTEEELIVQIY